MAHKSISSIGFGIAVVSLAGVLAGGCDSAPAATPPADAKAKTSTAADSQEPGAGTAKPAPAKGPRRLEAKRSSGSAPAPAPAAAGAAAPKADDPTAALLNPGDELEAAPAPVAPAPAAQSGKGKQATSAEKAAAARMAAENDAKRNASAAAARASQNPDVDSAAWSVLLATVSGPDSRATAMTIRDEVSRRYPSLRDAFVRSTQRGSVVLSGRFSSPQAPEAQARLKEVKEMTEGGVRAFPRAMLTRFGAGSEQGPPGPNDLRIVRQNSPTQTLYTLQVAVWSAFGTDELKMSEIKRSAEEYCRSLRSQGNEAYFFHDFDTRTSTVTVGVFGADAYDPRSTLYAPEVEKAMRAFPKHLVNGEELLVPVDPRNPGAKTIPQAPRLVEIPKF